MTVDLISRAMPSDPVSTGNNASAIQSASSVSADGRYVAFVSNASNLLQGDTNDCWDVFRKDMQTGAITRISTDSSGSQANSDSYFPSISADGRYIAFQSYATNLVPGDTNTYADIFVKDTQTGSLTRISNGVSNAQANNDSFAPAMSANGRYVAFYSNAGNLVAGDTNVAADIFVKDLQSGTLTRVSTDSSNVQGNGDSFGPAISADGRYVAFESTSSNLTLGDTNSVSDVFLKDTQTGTLKRVSTDSSNVQANLDSTVPAISADGRFVAFQSIASNLVSGDTNGTMDIFLKDVQTGSVTRVSSGTGGDQANSPSYAPSVSADGHYVAFYSSASTLLAGDTNGTADVFLKDTQSGTLVRVSTDGSNGQANFDSYALSINADGRYVTFYSFASNLVSADNNGMADVFLKDVQSSTLTLVSNNFYSTLSASGNASSQNSKVSANGRYVAFASNASNLVSDDTNGKSDVFVKDLQTGTISRVSIDANGTQGNGDAYDPTVSADGRYVVFASDAANLVAGDTNGTADLFVKDMVTGSLTRISTNSSGLQATGGSSNSPALSANGRYVAFVSSADNLVAGDTNGAADVFVKDTLTGAVSRASTDLANVWANGASSAPAISSDGRFVAFASDASNLVSGDVNGVTDVFVKDLQTGVISRVSSDSSSGEANGTSLAPAVSSDGRYVAFVSDATNLVSGDSNGASDVFVKDTVTGGIVRVSTDGSDGQANGSSSAPVMTADGRYVVFASAADNLVAGDTNNARDVFFKDLQTGSITRVSTDAGNVLGNGGSYLPSVSADGRMIVFGSDASNLVSSDSNSESDIFAKDTQTGGLSLVSNNYFATHGVAGNAASDSPKASADGRYVTFASVASNLVPGDTNGVSDIFVRDTQTGTVVRVSTDSGGFQGNGSSTGPSISADGRYVVFQSTAINLVPGDTNGIADIFLKDLQTGSVTRISTDSSDTQAVGGNSYSSTMSGDGRYVVFASDANNLVAGDTNGATDVFIKDTQTGVLARVSTNSSGSQATGGGSFAPAVSSDGRYVAFYSTANNLVTGDTNGMSDVFLKDLQTGIVLRVSTNSANAQSTDDSYFPSISADGRYVAFYSYANNLVTGDNNAKADVFVKDTQTGVITRVSTNSANAQATGGNSFAPALSADGRYVAFASDANNLISGDTNSATDVFVKDTLLGTLTRVSRSSRNAEGNNNSFAPSLSSDGRFVVFASHASNLDSDDANTFADVYRVSLVLGAVGTISASLDGAGNLSLLDVDAIGKDNQLTIKRDGSGRLVVSDTNEMFVAAPSDWTLSQDRRSISILASAFAGTIFVNGAGGSDTLTLDSSIGGIPATSFDGGIPGAANTLNVVGSQGVSLNALSNLTTIHLDASSVNTLQAVTKENVERISSASGELTLVIQPDDVVGFSSQWSYGTQLVHSGNKVHVLTANAVALFIQNDRLQNPLNPTDTNGDGVVSPVDSLLVVNALNMNAGGQVSSGAYDSLGLVDVSGDNNISPVDALLVINWLNAQSLLGGEAEAMASGVEDNASDVSSQEDIVFGDLFWLDDLAPQSSKLLGKSWPK